MIDFFQNITNNLKTGKNIAVLLVALGAILFFVSTVFAASFFTLGAIFTIVVGAAIALIVVIKKNL